MDILKIVTELSSNPNFTQDFIRVLDPRDPVANVRLFQKSK